VKLGVFTFLYDLYHFHDFINSESHNDASCLVYWLMKKFYF